jgi:methionyl-tRNA formyltransferase
MHMSNRDHPPHSRILFFGTRGLFSRVVLEVLLARGQGIAGIFVPGGAEERLAPLSPPRRPPSEIPLLPSYVEHSVVEVGWGRGLPVWSVGKIDEAALEVARELEPVAIGVACWPGILPASLTRLPRWGSLNVHPSLLPEYRGPAPLFWQVRDGLREAGVTIHRLSSRFDEGPILAQCPLRLPRGATGAELDQLAAEVGGELLGEVLDGFQAGNAAPREQPAGGSYQGWPEEKDFEAARSWSVGRAWNFMRATFEWGIPYMIRLPGDHRIFINPEAFYREPLAVPDAEARLSEPLERKQGYTHIAFNPGVLSVRSVYVSERP